MPDVIVFDLFDTLVDLRWEELPLVDWGEGPQRSTFGVLHEVLQPVNGMTLAEFASALKTADAAFKYAYWNEDREITTERRFGEFIDGLGLDGHPDHTGIVGRLTAAHLGALTHAASTPVHHREVLGRLRSRCRLAVCSNYSHTPNALHILERDGLREYFDVVVVSADVGLRKPHPRIFERVFEELDLPLGSALHVGDSLAKDVVGAAPLGLETVWITRRIEDPAATRADYDGPPPDHVIAELSELEALLG